MNSALIIALIWAVILPFGMLIWWKSKTHEKLWPFIAGALCFYIFASNLEGLLHQLCLVSDNAVSRAINGSAVLFTLYAAFAAGIFEETARLFGFKVLLKKRTEKTCAVAYGIGHGGIEVLLVLGVTYLIYMLATLGVPMGDADTTAQVVTAAQSIPISMVLFACLERASAMMVHIGLSMAMFVATKQKGKIWLYPCCICFHALVDVPAALYQFKVLPSLAIVEGLTLVLGVLALILGSRILAGYQAPQPDISDGGQDPQVVILDGGPTTAPETSDPSAE